MLNRHHDPILAIATAPGRGAVGVVRVSGKSLQGLVLALFGRALPPRQALYLPFCDAAGVVIDKGLAIYFPGPHSFTGEDVLELQAHGGQVVLQLLLGRCLEVAAGCDAQTGQALLPGLRLAEAGEFSQRAFLNNKMDLAQAEAIADLIDASTEAAARSAAQSLSGAFSREIQALLAALTHLRMVVEATLDFPEEDIDFLQQADASGQLQHIQRGVQAVFAQARQGALLREGIRVVIAGQPNAGKSSLLNALAGAELASVTPIPGTTRDRVQQTIQIAGVPIHVIDTAGLRDSDELVEQIGIARSWEAIAAADVLVFLHDLTRASQPATQAADADIARRLAQTLPPSVPVLDVWNKADAAPEAIPAAARAAGIDKGLALSAKTGMGLDALRQALLAAAGWQAAAAGGTFMARERHLQALRRVQEHCSAAAAHVAAATPALDLLAEELRLAQNALAEITGAFSSDDLLGVIFSQFCIGK
ncbi:MAG: tRNA uridine-5-carboxymethylaminomethyl(34) synthesis GTPase MnmE [Rhodoferax sp.]|nr:tRNA uridine-5-carboxymethylaminomethyl(34) synthesis GTPase MnmE [Rhodoferax sp.]